MPIEAGGFISLKPVGGIVTNNPAMTDQQLKAAEDAAAQRAQERQQQVDNIIDKFAEQQNSSEKRWSVPFK